MTSLPTPEYVEPQRVYSLLCAGIGGSGVLTLAGIIAMAAHLQGHQVRTRLYWLVTEKRLGDRARKNAPRHIEIHSPRVGRTKQTCCSGVIKSLISLCIFSRIEPRKSLAEFGLYPNGPICRRQQHTTDVAPLVFDHFDCQAFDANTAARRLFGDLAAVGMC